MKTKSFQYVHWKKQLVSDPQIMGGTTVFPNSRLTVRHIGGMALKHGEVAYQEIMEDYPYLTRQDVDFAKQYVQELRGKEE